MGHQALGVLHQLSVSGAERVGGQHDVLLHRHALDQIEALEHEAEGVATDPGEKSLRQTGDYLIIQHDASGGGAGETTDHRQQGCLAGTAGALEAGHPIGLDAQGDTLNRPELVGPALVEGLPDVL